MSQDFRPPFFSWFEPIKAPDEQLKYFRILFRFIWEIRIFKKLCGVHPTAESDSAVCITPLFWVKLRGVHHTVESSSVVCIPLLSQALRCAWYHGVKLLGVHPTEDSSDQHFFQNSLVCIPPPSLTLRCASHHWVRFCGLPSPRSQTPWCASKPLSQAPRCASYCIVWLGGVHPTAESVLTKCPFWFEVKKILSTVEEGNLERVSNFEQKKGFLF